MACVPSLFLPLTITQARAGHPPPQRGGLHCDDDDDSNHEELIFRGPTIVFVLTSTLCLLVVVLVLVMVVLCPQLHFSFLCAHVGYTDDENLGPKRRQSTHRKGSSTKNIQKNIVIGPRIIIVFGVPRAQTISNCP